MNHELTQLEADVLTLLLARTGVSSVATPERVQSARARLALVSGIEVVDLLLIVRENNGMPELFAKR